VQAVPHRAERNDARQQLKALIDTGGYEPGDRLPAERELISSLGISRSILRKGLEALEREGAIWRHVGKGTFVATSPSDTTRSDNISSLPGLAALSQQVTPVQMMRARLSLEPAIAREAAANASAEAVGKLHKAHTKSKNTTSWEAYETQDDKFHHAIAEATGNIMLTSLFDHLNQVRRTVTWAQVVRSSKKPAKNHTSFLEHDVIVNAIEARDPNAAHKAMREHLNSVSARLFGDP